MHGQRSRPWQIILALVFFAYAAVSAIAESEVQPGLIELELERPPTPQEAVWIQVRAATLPRGVEIRVSTRDGTLLGTVSSLGESRGREIVTYAIPLPETAIVNNRVQLRLEVDEPGAPVRAPRPDEVEGVNLVYVPISN
ncbi:MAG TPA: hypothetical protein VF780_06670 [Nitrosospira sp.]